MNNENGFLNINKPLNITSMDVIRYLRKVTKIKKIGHAGTLDPLASGVLLVAIGKYTKKINEFMGMVKKYETTIDLRSFSTTDDAEGEKTEVNIQKKPNLEEIEKTIKNNFIGDITQIPPIYSALKIKGKKAYELAREGKNVEMKPRQVKIDAIKILNYEWPYLTLDITCSKGTYIRSLGRDIGKELNTGGYLTMLKRTAIGNYTIQESVELSKINSGNWKNYLQKINNKNI
ncbi:TruB family pseudouridylate synthase (N terminal domain) [seawater metagenome]|uniref:tRNA pseudouridine(55) synthase n=1 Tax=seawater metagenome TaxID=1561972 RepID=A0A5E8CJV8_9ZZZZ